MKSKLLKTALLSLTLALALALPASASTIGGGTVNATALNLRSEANTASASQTLIPGGAFLLVEKKLDGWYKVLYNGKEGYAAAEFIDFYETISGSYGCKAVVSGNFVRLRSEPSTEGMILGHYDTGAQFSVLGVSGQWIQVKSDTGLEGYIHSDYLLCAGEAHAAAAAADCSGEDVVESAKAFLGTAYVWGGMSPSGFDCSGFVNYIYQLYGRSMYRVAQDIYSNNGTSVSKDELQQGDLVFFGYSGSNITHVGMYIGEGQFIHASSAKGKVVITDLSTNYYTRMYVGAKRILN